MFTETRNDATVVLNNAGIHGHSWSEAAHGAVK
jgi:hypothetical protein